MERRLNDNALSAPDRRGGTGFVLGVEAPGPFRDRELEAEPVDVGSKLNALRTGDFGPCLYLGPAGERCTRPAMEGGFCARHRRSGSKYAEGPGEDSRFRLELTPKRLGALIAAAAALWPIVADLVKEILRHFR
jgi:hypothetical protein